MDKLPKRVDDCKRPKAGAQFIDLPAPKQSLATVSVASLNVRVNQTRYGRPADEQEGRTTGQKSVTLRRSRGLHGDNAE
jgi:hypothetical protein